VIIDAPGHKEFLKNMVTGAANAEAALLLIDAREGVKENSRRHGYLLNLLGIRQIAVLVNKMDLENYSQTRFNHIESEYRPWLRSIGVEPKCFIPVSARHGDNLAAPGPRMPWWHGPTVLQTLDDFKAPELPKDQPLRFSIQDVYRFDERRILAGRVEAGTIRVGDKLLFCPLNKTSIVKSIERWNAPAAAHATAGESIGITLSEQIFVARGAVAVHETAPPSSCPAPANPPSPPSWSASCSTSAARFTSWTATACATASARTSPFLRKTGPKTSAASAKRLSSSPMRA
jgi:bifunctional enzyme CysN/CysC